MINNDIYLFILTNSRDKSDRETLALIPGTMEHQVGVLTQTVRTLQMKKAPECPVR